MSAHCGQYIFLELDILLRYMREGQILEKQILPQEKSINLALSVRGWKALDDVGVGDTVREIAIPMYGRVMHAESGELTYQPYGEEGQAIYSVSRGHINARMMDIAEKEGKATIHYHHECYKVDFENSIAFIKNNQTQETFEAKSDLIFATDGAFSAIRYNSMQKASSF